MNVSMIMIHKIMEHFKVTESASAGGKKANTKKIK